MINIALEKKSAKPTTWRSVKAALKIDLQIGKWLVLVWMLSYSFESQAQKVRAVSDLTSDEAELYLKCDDGPLDMSAPISLEEVKGLSFGTEANVFVQSFNIVVIRGGKGIFQKSFTSDSGKFITDLTDLIPPKEVELERGLAISFKIDSAVKMDDKTGEISPHRLKRPVVTFTIR